MFDEEPDPDSALKRLGGELAELLDDDQWNNVEQRYLLPALAELENARLDFQNAVSVGKKFESRLEALQKRIWIYEEAMGRIGSNESIMRGAKFCQNLAIETLKQ